MTEPITIEEAEDINGRQIIVYFSDATCAVFTVEDLLAYAPDRMPSDSRPKGVSGDPFTEPLD